MAPETTADRRSLVVAGVGFFGILVVLVVVAVVFAGDAGDERTPSSSTVACAPGDAACRAAQRSVGRPGIIPRPGEGHAPTDPGEPGGGEQVALFGAIVVALAAIAGLIVRSSRRARRAAAPDGTGGDGPP